MPGFEVDGVAAINFECVGILVGDTNLDGFLDLLDVEPFIFYLLTDEYQPQADANQDGVINLLDVAPLFR